MKQRTIATSLSFVVPGLGLFYLGKKSAGALNILLAISIPLIIGLAWTNEYLHYVFLAIATGSAGYTHATGTHSLTKEASSSSMTGQPSA